MLQVAQKCNAHQLEKCCRHYLRNDAATPPNQQQLPAWRESIVGDYPAVASAAESLLLLLLLNHDNNLQRLLPLLLFLVAWILMKIGDKDSWKKTMSQLLLKTWIFCIEVKRINKCFA